MPTQCDTEYMEGIIIDVNAGVETYGNKNITGDQKQFGNFRSDFSLGSCSNTGPDSFVSVDAVTALGFGELNAGMAGGRVAYHFDRLRIGAGTGVRYNFDRAKTDLDNSISGFRGLYGQLEAAVLFHPKDRSDYFGLRVQAMLTSNGDTGFTTGLEYGYK